MRIPIATYRFQFRREFTFARALELVPYLRELGISDLYASPLFPAGPESTHGYDVCSVDRLNPNLGAREEFDRLVAELRKHGMGLLLDIVPNHMGIHANNCWWQDVLKNGRNSKFARYFDVNWSPGDPSLEGKVLLPVLGDHYAAVLERGELKIKTGGDGYSIAYFDKEFPVSDESLRKLGISSAPPGKWSVDQLHSLIQMQHYRLAFWRVGPHEINYRRFFDITELVSMRVEDPEVFEATHRFIFDLIRSGAVTGLRVDHPDGLRDPKGYFERLQSGAGGDFYVVAEKILSDEDLPNDWPVAGTTGYDYLNYLNGLFVRAENEEAFTRLHQRFTGSGEDFEALAYRSKREALGRLFISELNSLTARLKALARQTRYGLDFTAADLRGAIIDFIAAFPVYRTYVTEQTENISAADTAFILRGLAEARKRNEGKDTRALDFLARILSLHWFADMTDDTRAAAREFVIRFQQLSGPATAKGLEDTAFYRYTRFISLNEVGGNPGRFGVSPGDFHEHNIRQQGAWPNSMLATATHDTKRGEDTRARLNVLSEMPEEWEKTVHEWREMNAAFKTNDAPAANDEYLLYQILVGTWTKADPEHYIRRLQDYMEKAMREAKTHTSWTDPNHAYENSTKEFITHILQSAPFLKALETFAANVAYFGMFNSLAQIVLKTCSPGVPDFYQGTELWDLSLVDPDNRQAVDYTTRAQLLQSAQKPAELLRNWQTGAVKLFTVAAALKARNEHAELFRGNYEPISVIGTKKDHVIAFARTAGKDTVIAAVPRFVRTLTSGKAVYPSPELWADTRLEFAPGKRFRNIFTGQELNDLRAAGLFETFPAAILMPLD